MITLPPELAAFAAGVKQRTLPNGLTALVVPRRGSATVHFAIAFGVGAVDEPEGRSGIAHLYEHMAFKGTPRIGTRNWPRERALLARLDALDEALALERARHAPDARKLARLKKTFDRTEAQAEKLVVPNELDELYQRNGAKGLNAYTSKDATVYIVNLPANRMALWAAIEGERVRTPVLRQFYRERNVVIEELRRLAFEQRVKDAFLEGRIRAPIHLSGGNEDQLIEVFSSVRPDDWVLSTWRSHYHALLHGIDPDWL
ncbi:MAG: insulinase family protein, partial [bacterium]